MYNVYGDLSNNIIETTLKTTKIIEKNQGVREISNKKNLTWIFLSVLILLQRFHSCNRVLMACLNVGVDLNHAVTLWLWRTKILPHCSKSNRESYALRSGLFSNQSQICLCFKAYLHCFLLWLDPSWVLSLKKSA